MKKICCMNGYTIFQHTKRDEKDGLTVGEFSIYFSSDIKDYGREYSYPEFEGIESLEICEELCDNKIAIAKELCEEESTCVSVEDIEAKIEEMEREEEKMAYDYLAEIKGDILDYIENEVTLSDFATKESLEEYLNDELWVEDSVTGNASGSYTFDRYKAEEYVKGNLALCIDACIEFGADEKELGKKVYDGEWEYLDVTIRCYLLGQAIAEVLEDVEL